MKRSRKFIGKDGNDGTISSDRNELRGLHELAARHVLVRLPLVTTRTYSGTAVLGGSTLVEFMPVALHCYTIANNLLRSG